MAGYLESVSDNHEYELDRTIAILQSEAWELRSAAQVNDLRPLGGHLLHADGPLRRLIVLLSIAEAASDDEYHDTRLPVPE